MIEILEGGTVKCACGMFYAAEVIKEGDNVSTRFFDITLMRDPLVNIGPHTCPDNQIRWHGPRSVAGSA